MDKSGTQDPSQLKTKARVTECAIQLIKQKGYNHTTIPEICKAAGITKSTFYYHFESKNDVLSNFTAHLGYIVNESLPQIILQETYLKQIWAVFLIYFESNEAVGPEIIQQIFVNLLNENKEEGFPYTMSAWNIVVNLTEKAKAAGQIRNSDNAEKIASALYTAIRGRIMTWAVEKGRFNLVDSCKILFKTILMPADDYTF